MVAYLWRALIGRLPDAPLQNIGSDVKQLRQVAEEAKDDQRKAFQVARGALVVMVLGIGVTWWLSRSSTSEVKSAIVTATGESAAQLTDVYETTANLNQLRAAIEDCIAAGQLTQVQQDTVNQRLAEIRDASPEKRREMLKELRRNAGDLCGSVAPVTACRVDPEQPVAVTNEFGIFPICNAPVLSSESFEDWSVDRGFEPIFQTDS